MCQNTAGREYGLLTTILSSCREAYRSCGVWIELSVALHMTRIWRTIDTQICECVAYIKSGGHVYILVDCFFHLVDSLLPSAHSVEAHLQLTCRRLKRASIVGAILCFDRRQQPRISP